MPIEIDKHDAYDIYMFKLMLLSYYISFSPIQAEVGKNYEVVLTSTMGLYRYRLGDVVKITGKFFTTPNYEFLYR